MTDRQIARDRANKAAKAAEESLQVSEKDGLQIIYIRTGGAASWRERWGFYDKADNISVYTGVIVNGDGVMELMLSDNGLTIASAENPDGVNFGEGLNALRFLQSLNLRNNPNLKGPLHAVFDSACALTRADHFQKKKVHRKFCQNDLRSAAFWTI